MSRINQDEGGAVAVIVAIFLVVFVAFGALAIDAGSAWETKRNLVTDMDAAALAGAQLIAAEGVENCGDSGVRAAAEQRARDTAALNDPDTVVDAVTIDCNSNSAVVTVDANLAAQETLSPAAGVTDLRAGGSSAAVVGPAGSAQGLLPFSLCRHIPVIAELLADGIDAASVNDPSLRGTEDRYPAETSSGASYADMGAGLVHRIPFDKEFVDDQDDSCGSAAGNWSWLSFHSMTAGTGTCGGDNFSQLRAMVCQGYGGGVAIPGECGIVPPARESEKDPKPTQEQDCWGDTGLGQSRLAALNNEWACTDTREACAQNQSFAVIIFSDVVGSGTGSLFTPIAFVGLVLRDVEQIPSVGRVPHLEIVRVTTTGSVDFNAPGGTGVTAVDLCGADGFEERCRPG